MIQEEESERGDPIDWSKVLPFEPVALSDRLPWVGMQAARCPRGPRVDWAGPGLADDRFVLLARPPEERDLRCDWVKRNAPPPTGSIMLVPAGIPVRVRSSGHKDELHIFLEAAFVERVA